MKKINFTIFLALILSFNMLKAQDAENILKNKNGNVILPKKGDIGLQMDATGILDFALNTVNIMVDNGQHSAHPGFTSGLPNIIVGKYFISDNRAIRARLGYNTSTTVEKEYGDDPLTPTISNPDNILLETYTEKTSDFMLGGGIEFRRGHGRIQGYYGADLNILLNTDKYHSEYGVAYNQLAQDSGYISLGDSRELEGDYGNIFTFNLRGFAGVEYFVLPKLSIGAEFGLGYSLQSEARGDYTDEFWDTQGSAVDGSSFTATKAYDYEDRERGFLVDQGVGGVAALNLTFHF